MKRPKVNEISALESALDSATQHLNAVMTHRGFDEAQGIAENIVELCEMLEVRKAALKSKAKKEQP